MERIPMGKCWIMCKLMFEVQVQDTFLDINDKTHHDLYYPTYMVVVPRNLALLNWSEIVEAFQSQILRSSHFTLSYSSYSSSSSLPS